MGAMGRYIDGLTDEERDRIIEAQAWCIGEFRKPTGEGCLIGNAADMGRDYWKRALPHRHQSAWQCDSVTVHFDRAVRRFTLARVVQACKKRAARGNRLPLTPSLPVHEAVGVGGAL